MQSRSVRSAVTRVISARGTGAGSLGSVGWGVGGDESQTTGSSQPPFVWTGGAIDTINTANFTHLIGEGGVTPSSITFTCGTGMNDAGDMLVWGIPSGSTYDHTYFISPTLLVVPEPSTLLLTATGLLGLLACAWRRRL